MFVCLESVLAEYVGISDSPFFCGSFFLPFRHRSVYQQRFAHAYFKVLSSPGVGKKSFKVNKNLLKNVKNVNLLAYSDCEVGCLGHVFVVLSFGDKDLFVILMIKI